MVEDFNPKDFVDKFSKWFESYLSESKAAGTVCGLSGGIDSAVVSVLLNKIIGKKHLALFIGIESQEADLEDARMLAEKFDLNFLEFDLTDVYLNLVQNLPEGNKIAYANLKPRLRMITLYFFANSQNRLVAGTGNKTEISVGYFTKYGDGACDFLPIGSIYKTQVRMLARYLGIPEKIIAKPPSAGLWKGQTDEGEMGIAYEELDRALFLIERGHEGSLDKDIYEKVMSMKKGSEHKRCMPEIFVY